MTRAATKPWRHLCDNVPADSLRLFRLAFGLLMAIAMVRFFVHGWIGEFYIAPSMHFTYTGFDWVRPWPGVGLYVHFAAVGLAALAFAVGYRYRLTLAAFLIGFVYIELLDKTTYLNHYYLVSLLGALMLLLPLDRRDLGRPIARWQLWVMRFQVGIVYFFAGVAKLNHDWLFSAQPLKLWFAANTDAPLIGPLLALPYTPWIASWAAMAMDVSAPFFLAWRRTRWLMLTVVVVFHATTAILFNLGLFPWLMIAAATLFLPPDWPKKVYATIRKGTLDCPLSHPTAAAPPIWLVTVLCGHFLFQTAWPLRHHVYDNDLHWTEDGFRFAWNVMVMEKAGNIAFNVTDKATGATWRVYPRDDLSPLQEKMMATQPDLILDYAHRLADRYAAAGYQVAVHADSRVALNGRPGRPLVDASVDLTTVPGDYLARRWLSPLRDEHGVP